MNGLATLTVIGLFLCAPLLLIWGLNTLFIQVTITYDFMSYLAAAAIMFCFGGLSFWEK